MNTLQFLNILNENVGLYFFSILLTAVMFLPVWLKQTQSWVDPLRVVLLFSVMANSVPVFLLMAGEILLGDFFYFISSEFLLWFGFFLAYKKPCFSKFVLSSDKELSFCLYVFFVAYHIASTGFVYLNFGIPAMQDSRLSVFAHTGFGTIQRLSPFVTIYCAFFSFMLLNESACNVLRRFIAYLVFVLLFFTSILSGAKSSVLVIAYGAFGFYLLYKRVDVKVKMRHVMLAIVSAIFINLISGASSVEEALLSLLIRASASGDVYWIAYPDQLYKYVTIPYDNSLRYFFSGVLAPLRVISEPVYSDGIGFQFTRLLNPELSDLLVGPNVRMPVLNKILFGWFGLFFSFSVGFILSIVIYRLPRVVPYGVLTVSFYTYVYVTLLTFFADPALGVGYLIDILFNFILLLFLVISFFPIVYIVRVRRVQKL